MAKHLQITIEAQSLHHTRERTANTSDYGLDSMKFFDAAGDLVLEVWILHDTPFLETTEKIVEGESANEPQFTGRQTSRINR